MIYRLHQLLLGVRRSSHWRAVRRRHLKNEPGCAVCGQRKRVDVHHVLPVHLAPELELIDANLITMCRKHHFEVGHLEDWNDYNPDVRYDAATLRQRARNEKWTTVDNGKDSTR